ncbi:hypothetical protein KBD08_02060 [Candidatus Babeliales bacterium]|nr:hypothetical protein [Candidatus Babeliales bacterium]
MKLKYMISTLCLLAICTHITMPGISRTSSPSPYQTLKIANTATQKQIDNAYQKLYKEARDARERFLIHKAYEAIRDPRQRHEYNQKVAVATTQQQQLSSTVQEYLEAHKRKARQQVAQARAEILLQRLENEPLTQELQDEFNNLIPTLDELNQENAELVQKLKHMSTKFTI